MKNEVESYVDTSKLRSMPKIWLKVGLSKIWADDCRLFLDKDHFQSVGTKFQKINCCNIVLE